MNINRRNNTVIIDVKSHSVQTEHEFLPSSVSPPIANDLRSELTAYGVQEALLLGGDASSDKVDYLDLIPGGGGRDRADTLFPEAVAESQGRPLLYVVNRASLSSDAIEREDDLRNLRRTLGSRGERAYLGIIEPGSLSVIPITLSPDLPAAQIYTAGTGRALTFFSRLSMGEYEGEGEPRTPDYVYAEMLELLEHAADRLANEQGLPRNDVLSLIGRALFFRFLCDRDIVKASSLRSVAPFATSLKSCFSTIANIASTSSWLDVTFNGDFLPLISDSIPTDNRLARERGYLDYLESLSLGTQGAVCCHLSAILEGHQPAGDDYQRLLWARFDFAHVPVGLLSQVYEAFSWKWSPDARETSVHYTPRHIANYLVEEAFHGVVDGAAAKVLDPACGAGVFLVLAFRKLYQQQWENAQRNGAQRPDTRAIRDILDHQIAGFDVSEGALRLAALSLYLTAIELDPNPVPPSKLRFKNLRNRVLFDCRQPQDPPNGPVIGSIGDHVGNEHHGIYDVVLCNPPWTSLDGAHVAVAHEMGRISKKIIRRRVGVEHLAENYQNPDSVPDLPFLWRATEWCRPGGRIGMVLPGRNLFKQEHIPSHAREVIFRALSINGILNCANLSDTKVWPEMNQPFILLFACNKVPGSNHVVRWVTPLCDVGLNKRGDIRVDSTSVDLINVERTFDEPWLWKALSIGTSLDVEVIRKSRLDTARPLLKYWKEDLGLSACNGYSIKVDEQSDASHLHGLPNLDSTSTFRFEVQPERLAPFTRATLGRPRAIETYRGPLALVKGFPGQSRQAGWALLSRTDVAFKQNFFGYSGNGHPQGEGLVRYLHLFVHSFVWMHRVLMTSPKLGVERREFYKTDLDSAPFIPYEKLNLDDREVVETLSERLIAEDNTVFSEIDEFFAGLYGLTALDAETIFETIEFCLPFGEVRDNACKPAPEDMQDAFAARVASILRPFLRKRGKDVCISRWRSEGALSSSVLPFSVLVIGSNQRLPTIDEGFFQEQVLALANETGASRVILELEGGLVVAVLNHRRYWTQSRARLCAAEILNRHMAPFSF